MLQIILLSVLGVTFAGWILNLLGWLKPLGEFFLVCGGDILELIAEILSGLGD